MATMERDGGLTDKTNKGKTRFCHSLHSNLVNKKATAATGSVVTNVFPKKVDNTWHCDIYSMPVTGGRIEHGWKQ